VFDTTFATCRIDCSQSSTNSNGAQFEYDSCYCTAANTAWSYTSNACYINCSNGVNVDASTCTCNSGFVFNSIVLTCSILNCSALTYSTGVNKNNTTCLCQKNYFFDSITGQCIADSHHSHAVAIAVGIAVPLDVLILIALSLILWFALTPAAAVAPPVIVMPVSQLALRVIHQPITSTRIVSTSNLPITRPVVSGFRGIPRF
jgi:hypothetical protein